MVDDPRDEEERSSEAGTEEPGGGAGSGALTDVFGDLFSMGQRAVREIARSEPVREAMSVMAEGGTVVGSQVRDAMRGAGAKRAARGDLADEVAALRAEVEELRAELAELRERVG